MSEYIEFDYDYTDDPNRIEVTTNVLLTSDDEVEMYSTIAEGDEGSPLAQALYMVPGLVGLTLDTHQMTLIRDENVPWHGLIEDIRDALRDFFL